MVASGAGASSLTAIAAGDYFSYLPAAGSHTDRQSQSLQAGFDYLQFFSKCTYRGPVFIEGAKVDQLLRLSFQYQPIDLSGKELLWIYQVRANQQGIDKGGAATPILYMLFTSGQIAFQGKADFDLNYFNYANFF